MKTRKAARLLLINERDELFLFCHEEATQAALPDSGPRRYWVTPGGGVEPGESWEAAAARELWEETGIAGVPLGPWVWSREKDAVLFGELMRGVERYYLVRVTGAAISAANQLDYERAAYQRQRWWTVAEIDASDDVFFPEGLARHLAPLLAGEMPSSPVALHADS